MNVVEIILIGLGLSMDAVAVSMTNGMVYPNLSQQKQLTIPLFFGLFQGLMPLFGYLTGGLFADFFSRYANIAIFLILGIIGSKMVKDGSQPAENLPNKTAAELTCRLLLVQAIATSIDAFAVGIGFSAVGINILSAVLLIAVTTFICSTLAVRFGRTFGNMLGGKAEVLGGVILLCLAIKAVL